MCFLILWIAASASLAALPVTLHHIASSYVTLHHIAILYITLYYAIMSHLYPCLTRPSLHHRSRNQIAIDSGCVHWHSFRSA